MKPSKYCGHLAPSSTSSSVRRTTIPCQSFHCVYLPLLHSKVLSPLELFQIKFILFLQFTYLHNYSDSGPFTILSISQYLRIHNNFKKSIEIAMRLNYSPAIAAEVELLKIYLHKYSFVWPNQVSTTNHLTNFRITKLNFAVYTFPSLLNLPLLFFHSVTLLAHPQFSHPC